MGEHDAFGEFITGLTRAGDNRCFDIILAKFRRDGFAVFFERLIIKEGRTDICGGCDLAIDCMNVLSKNRGGDKESKEKAYQNFPMQIH